MPIRLNLLAEAQEAEEMRRQDPVKRVFLVGLVLICLMLMWCSSLQLRILLAKGDLSRDEARISQRTNDYRHVLESQKKIGEIGERVTALHRLCTNRFLNGTLLDALQRTMVEDVQLLHVRINQSYTAVELPKPRAVDDRTAPGPTAAVAERVILLLDANDCSPNPGDQINNFKEAVAANPYFREMLDKTNAITLKNLSPPQTSPTTGKPSVLFTLECRFRERTR
jgi:hypothetical protein